VNNKLIFRRSRLFVTTILWASVQPQWHLVWSKVEVRAYCIMSEDWWLVVRHTNSLFFFFFSYSYSVLSFSSTLTLWSEVIDSELITVWTVKQYLYKENVCLVGSALHARVMAKLFPKLKLVSFLAVLLLCQFGYVACQPTDSSDSPLLPADEGTHARYTFPSVYISFSYYIQKKEENLLIC